MIRDCTEAERHSLARNVCPDCNAYKEFLLGPCGGFCQNIRCGRCGSEFNVGPIVNGQHWPAERISEKSPKLAIGIALRETGEENHDPIPS